MAAGIEDVARAAGVSTATVSRALRNLPNVNEGTRDRVRAAAAALGYVASPSAASLASGPSACRANRAAGGSAAAAIIGANGNPSGQDLRPR